MSQYFSFKNENTCLRPQAIMIGMSSATMGVLFKNLHKQKAGAEATFGCVQHRLRQGGEGYIRGGNADRDQHADLGPKRGLGLSQNQIQRFLHACNTIKQYQSPFFLKIAVYMLND